MRADRVTSHGRWNNERLRVVHNKGHKFSAGALYNRLFPFDKIQHVHSATRLMRDNVTKPVTSSFDEFAFVESSTLLAPTGPLRQSFHLANQILLHPLRRALPLHVRLAV